VKKYRLTTISIWQSVKKSWSQQDWLAIQRLSETSKSEPESVRNRPFRMNLILCERYPEQISEEPWVLVTY